jgi:hypothetical protein
MIESTDMVFTHGLMEDSTLDNGKMESSMGKEYTDKQVVKKEEGTGRMENG